MKNTKCVFLVVCMFQVACTFQYMHSNNVQELFSVEKLTVERYKRQIVHNNCTEERHQQLQDWMPEGCPSVEEMLILINCSKLCGQYLYEGVKECYGDVAANYMDRFCAVNETGSECYIVANQYKSLNICGPAELSHRICSPNCAQQLQVFHQIYGCCFITAAWLQVPTPENEAVIKNQSNLCNVSSAFCAATFSESIIGVPPIMEKHMENAYVDSNIDIGLTAGLSTLAVIIGVFLFVFLVILIVLYHTRKRKQIHEEDEWTIARKVSITAPSENSAYIDTFRRSSIDEIRETVPLNKLFSKDKIELQGAIGHGESGLVYKAYVDSGGEKIIAAVKTGKAIFTKIDTRKLIKEVTTMLSFDHPNVMTVIGLCLDTAAPLIIMPFMSNGSVLDYLKCHRKELHIENKVDDVKMRSAQTFLLGICHQIAKGMSYLAERKFVHRDLAARNCMMDHNGVVKVGDFGLTEDMYGTNYYRRRKSKAVNERVPIRWMAPESIVEDIYNEKTDVWSFGVTCWEVFTCGRVPFSGIKIGSLLATLRNGERLEKPLNTACLDEIYLILLQCWEADPIQRIQFNVLVQQLSHILERDGGYLDLSDSIKT